MGAYKGFKESCNLGKKKTLYATPKYLGNLVLIYLLHIFFSYFQNELGLIPVTFVYISGLTYYVLSHAHTPKGEVERNECSTCISF